MLSRRKLDTCPCCGQRMLLRHGVRLAPNMADLFDMIERAGKDGITSEVLADVFYPGVDLAVARNRLKCNIYHTNLLLGCTDIEIRAGSGGDRLRRPYRIQKRRNP